MFRDPRANRDDVAAAGRSCRWYAMRCSVRRASKLALLLVVAGAGPALAQTAGPDDLLRPGEAYVTRFSGTTMQADLNGQQPSPIIDTAGTVGSIIDIRSPRRPPRGEHWYDEPQRRPVTAGEVGQVFGVVLDDATPPNIYLSATSAFGLHLAAGSLPPIMFDPKSGARITNCAAGPFERSPQCWNFAASGRRVWGLGVHRDLVKNETRLYYAVWSSPTFGYDAQWNAASDDDKRNSVWSIRLGPDGNFEHYRHTT
jgi:hypothetical protein